MTAAEFNANEFQLDDIIEITFNDNSIKTVHLHQGHAYIPENVEGVHHSQILVIGGEENIEGINLLDVKSVSLNGGVNNL